jgi:hypothetical protein
VGPSREIQCAPCRHTQSSAQGRGSVR